MKAWYAAVIVAAVAVIEAGSQTPARPAAPDRERAWRANNLGVAQLEQYDYAAATGSFTEALRISPDLRIARVNLAIALFYGNRPAEAATEARVAATSLPDSPSAHYVLGLIAKADDRLSDAAAAFERVLALDPRDPGARVQLGQIHLQQRKYAEALQLFQTALTDEPYNVTAAYNAALALTRGGRADEGRQAMEKFQSLRDSAYGVTYSQTYLAQGRYAEAIASTGAEPELVDPATPDVTFAEATSAFLPAADTPQAQAPSAGGITLFDLDGDGDLDLAEIGPAGARLLRNDGRRLADDTARAGLASARTAGTGVVAGDFDNDGRPDLLLLQSDGTRLLHQKTNATFEDIAPSAGLGAPGSSAALADVDHDGDLDIVIAGATTRVLRNNGNSTVTEITAAAGFGGSLDHPVAIAPTDFDNRRDIDILVADAGRGPVLFRNMRDGSFRDATAEAGLPSAPRCTALAVGDVNKDGFPDLFLGRRDEPGLLALSDGHGSFRIVPAADATRAAIAAQFVDYDNDGLLDLLTASDRRVRLFRNIGGDRWTDVSVAARLDGLLPDAAMTLQSVALGDLDHDGDTDLVLRTASGRLRVWRNDGGNRHASLRVALTARVSNRSALGAKVEMRAGSLRQVLETSSASPAVAPADLIFGLGSRSTADVVRALWPSGILQAETSLGRPDTSRAQTVTVTELDRKPSSCPYLFTWNGSRFEFITDFMGGGEMGDWLAPGVWNQPDPDEYVRIRGDQLKPRDGRYELRITNELEEALFVDRLQLIAVDHPAGVEVFPNEGLTQPRRPPFRLIGVADARPPVRATDEHGHDVLSRIAAIDRHYPDDFARLPIRGYAAPHELILDLGSDATRPVLLLTGWTDYAFSSDNVAASHNGTETILPLLQVRDQSGTWRTAIDEIGLPVGRPQTIAVDLEGKFLSASREVRIVTTMRIYWDQILVGSLADQRSRLTRLDPVHADLRWRGLSTEVTPDGREPFGYDYEHVSTTVPWKMLVGHYTREGNVRPLLRAIDDMFVISRPGDEISLSFDARALPAPATGWSRTFLLYANGYSKEMNPRSATTDTLAPLPFRGMTRYPYGDDEHYPRTPAHREYLERYNTRIVSRVLPPIDAMMAR
jgi:tetratricopeptide (TPR) repeat protein